jgi:secretion/DNA translocation related CpaE-like protein
VRSIPTQPDPAGRPLLVCADPVLTDDLLRLAAAASVEAEVAHDPVSARGSWSSAPMVLVGAETVQACARARLPARRRVVVVAGRYGRPSRSGDDAVPVDIWRLAAMLDAEQVACLPEAETWLVDRLADAATGPSAGGRVVAVLGGRGGGGASVLASALAVTAARSGLRPLLVDADPYGGGLDLVLGGEEISGLRWPDLVSSSGRVSVPALYKSLPRMGELCVLSWDRGDPLEIPTAAIDTALDAGRRGSDLVVVDLPRRQDEPTVRVLQVADTVLMVVPAEVRACAAASRLTAVVRPHCADLRAVVRGPAPAGLRSREFATALGLPLAGVLRPEPGLAAALDRGEAPSASGRGPLAVLCRKLLAEFEILPGSSDAA